MPKVPALHKRQEDWPGVGLYAPGGQGKQEAGALAKVPAGQDADEKGHSAERAALYKSMAQGVHDVWPGELE